MWIVEGHLLCTHFEGLQSPQISQSAYDKSAHQSCLGLRFFLPLKALSENALAIKGVEAVSKASSSNADLEKIPRNLAPGHKGEKDYPSFEIPIYDP